MASEVNQAGYSGVLKGISHTCMDEAMFMVSFASLPNSFCMLIQIYTEYKNWKFMHVIMYLLGMHASNIPKLRVL